MKIWHSRLGLIAGLLFSSVLSLARQGKEPVCHIVTSNQSGTIARTDLKRLDGPTSRAGKTDFEYFDGYFCHRKNQSLEGRFSFEDPSKGKWTVVFTVEKLKSRNRLSVVTTRSGKRYGPQFDTEFTGDACSILGLTSPLSLIGLETEDQKWFSVSVDCETGQ
jgi:hypothetical protein